MISQRYSYIRKYLFIFSVLFLLSSKIIDIFSNDYRIAFMYGAVTLVIALLFVLPIKRGEALSSKGLTSA